MSWDLTAGDVLAHYRIVSPLGAGGMGQVYLAEDQRLGRRVALKVLSRMAQRDEARLVRFEREARAISALNHPNILTIYDVGHEGDVHFFCTEYVDGATLRRILERQRMSVSTAVDVAIQVAQALSAAHDAGVVHRDVKPENVMVRADGYVKVLDFGLAKLRETDPILATDEADTRLVETAAGVVMGTFSYMAPEQARGVEIDARADLFSLGVVLYEMLAGRLPFGGRSTADVIGALLLRAPEPLDRIADVPQPLARIVATALEKEPANRHATCAIFAQALRDLRLSSDLRDGSGAIALATSIAPWTHRDDDAVGGAPSVRASRAGRRTPAPEAITVEATPRRGRRRIESLAVLPLVNAGSDLELNYLADGLTESLINNLSQLPRLRVMARSTVFAYKGPGQDPRAAGRALEVGAVLAGRVAQRGDLILVSAELVNVDDGSQVWGTSLARPMSDVFALQGDIAHEITTALRLKLTRAEKKRIARPQTLNPVAYQLYLRGRYFLNERTGDALKRAHALFERAVVEDPHYALAHAGLADCCALLAVSLRSSDGTVLERAREAAAAALRIDDSLPEAHASTAFIKFRFDWKWEEAQQAFARALRLNPGHAPSRQWHAMFLAARSRFADALAEMHRAADLDPLSLVIQGGIGRILHFAGSHEKAVHQFEHVLDANPDFAQARIDLALTWMALDRFDAAREQLRLAEEVLGTVSTVNLLRVCCAARDGAHEQGRAALTQLRAQYAAGAAGADDLALATAALGDWEEARTWLAVACQRRAPFLGYVDVEPAMAPLRADGACRVLLRQHGFDALPVQARSLSHGAG